LWPPVWSTTNRLFALWGESIKYSGELLANECPKSPWGMHPWHLSATQLVPLAGATAPLGPRVSLSLYPPLLWYTLAGSLVGGSQHKCGLAAPLHGMLLGGALHRYHQSLWPQPPNTLWVGQGGKLVPKPRDLLAKLQWA